MNPRIRMMTGTMLANHRHGNEPLPGLSFHGLIDKDKYAQVHLKSVRRNYRTVRSRSEQIKDDMHGVCRFGTYIG